MPKRDRLVEVEDEVTRQVEARARELRPRADLAGDPVWQLVHQTNRSDVVSIDRCSFSERDCAKAVAYLAPFNSLQSLRLQLGIGGKSMSAFFTVISQCGSSLRTIDLSRNRLDAASASSIALLCASLPHLSSLDLSYNPIGDEGAQGLIELLCSHPTLSVLHLRHCHLSDASARYLARGLCQIPSSRKVFVCVSQNRIGSEGLSYLRAVPLNSVSISATSQMPRVAKR
jgi:hypothetical protein